MRHIFLSFLFTFIASCTQPTPKVESKQGPQHSAEITDPELKVIVDTFLILSERNNVRFTNNVSIGFSKIDRGSVIGTCSFGNDFREIDIDAEYWKRTTWTSKVALLYHELTHCYCQRDHDFDNGEMYPDRSLRSFLESLIPKQMFSPLREPGYLPDLCPKSIMHPTLLDDECFEAHYDYYVKEMFNRCQPW